MKLHRTNLVTREYGREYKVLTDKEGNLYYRCGGHVCGTFRNYCFDASDEADVIRYMNSNRG